MGRKQLGIQEMLDNCRITTEEYYILIQALDKLTIKELVALHQAFKDYED